MCIATCECILQPIELFEGILTSIMLHTINYFTLNKIDYTRCTACTVLRILHNINCTMCTSQSVPKGNEQTRFVRTFYRIPNRGTKFGLKIKHFRDTLQTDYEKFTSSFYA